MRDYYKINEISKLYGIGVDSLRYYEKLGVLKPKRDVNGYRLYSLKDIYKLTIIRDLRQLDFSMKQIKEYLDHQTIEQTLKLLREEQELIQEQLKNLRIRKQMIHDRISTLTTATQIPTGSFTIKTLPARPCVQLNEYITRDEEMDFAIKKLHQKHANKIRDFGNQAIGASVSVEDLHNNVLNVFHSVFFILEHKTVEYDFVLPAGQYLSCFYRGDYRQSSERIREVLTYAQKINRPIAGDPFEIYEIDNRYTMCENEFLTEIQVKVSD